MFIELHVIQNFSPSNLNRDDTGRPKETLFGGYRRARISSQSFKRAIRHLPLFAEKTQLPLGQRTKLMAGAIAERLVKAGHDASDAKKVAGAVAATYAGRDKKNPEKTSVLVYLSQEELDAFAATLHNQWETVLAEIDGGKQKIIGGLVKNLTNTLKDRTSAPDIALFGRMLANEPITNLDAACQVAHALSTHRVTMEHDYFTAVDDLKPQQDTGSEMIGSTVFNSACYYRYARVDWNKLIENLGGNRNPQEVRNTMRRAEIEEVNLVAVALARRTVEAFLRATVEAIPTGKQNAFAAQNPTSLAMVVVRRDGMSWNLANAFEIPIRAVLHDEEATGFVRPSIKALDAEWRDKVTFYDEARIEAVSVRVEAKHLEAVDALRAHIQPTQSRWIATVLDALPEA